MDEEHERMLSIGEFAARTRLTRKALRIYERNGLLEPAAVDEWTGIAATCHSRSRWDG